MGILTPRIISSFSVLLVCILSSIPFNYSLSTISISQVNNRTSVCAVSLSTTQQAYLNCTSFPPGIRAPDRQGTLPVSGVVGGDGFFCSLSSTSLNSTMVCWRFSVNGTNFTYKRLYQGPALKELDSGNSHICGIVNETNRLQCWQWRGFDLIGSSEISESVAVGDEFVCGLTESGQIQCRGGNENVTNSVPQGNYRVVAAGDRQACAISLDGSLDCWGDTRGEAPHGDFESLSLGGNRVCAIRRPNRTVVCWGENGFSLREPLRDTQFLSLESKREVFCGVLALNFSLICWGNEILDSTPTVFDRVLPGPCTSQCPCGTLPGSGSYCGQGLVICDRCFPEPSPENPPSSGSEGWSKKMVAFLVVGCIGSFGFVLVFGFLVYSYCNVRGCRVHDSGRLDEEARSQLDRQGSRSLQVPPVLEKRLSHLISLGNASVLEEFSLEAIHNATDDFSEEKRIGTGSYGSVYHGKLEDGREVAIKRAEASASSSYAGGTKRGQEDTNSAFLAELEFLSRLNHKNLVKLLGYCEECNERVLVYEYMSNGTVHDHLHSLENPHLTSWPARIKVALDAARGIEYLHEYAVPQIIHRDIKSSNILLDSTWTAKVSDFGLSLLGPQDDMSHLSLRAAGTVGYMDPEYYRLQQLTAKSDVYSFGVVLLELLSGSKAIHRNENGVPRNVVDYVVPYIVQDEIHRVLDKRVPPPTPFEIEAVSYVGYLAADCVMLEGRDRPPMSDIVNSLERALEACLASPTLPRSPDDSEG